MKSQKILMTTAMTLSSLCCISSGATLSLDNLHPIDGSGPNNDNSTGDATEIKGTANLDGIVSTTQTAFAIANTEGAGVSSDTYTVSVTGIDFDTFTDVSLTFDLTLTAGGSNTNGANNLIRIYRNVVGNTAEERPGWSVDNADVTSTEHRIMNVGETITFSVNNIVVSDPGFTATFGGFQAAGFNDNGSGGTGSFNTATGIASVLTGTGSNGVHVRDLDLNFDLQAVPEPSSTALLGLGVLGFLMHRKR